MIPVWNALALSTSLFLFGCSLLTYIQKRDETGAIVMLIFSALLLFIGLSLPPDK